MVSSHHLLSADNKQIIMTQETWAIDKAKSILQALTDLLIDLLAHVHKMRKHVCEYEITC